MNVHAIKRQPESDTRSPERQALAQAIARNILAADKVAALQGALSEATQAVYKARRAVEAREEEIGEAKENAAKHAVATFLKELGKAPISIREARNLLQEAQDELETAQQTRDALVSQLTKAGEQPGWTESDVKTAVLNVVRAEANCASIYDRFVRTYEKFADARKLLQLMESIGVAKGAIASHSPEPRTFEHPSAAAWRTAMEALETNPDAPLPEY